MICGKTLKLCMLEYIFKWGAWMHIQTKGLVCIFKWGTCFTFQTGKDGKDYSSVLTRFQESKWTLNTLGEWKSGTLGRAVWQWILRLLSIYAKGYSLQCGYDIFTERQLRARSSAECRGCDGSRMGENIPPALPPERHSHLCPLGLCYLHMGTDAWTGHGHGSPVLDDHTEGTDNCPEPGEAGPGSAQWRLPGGSHISAKMKKIVSGSHV